VSMQLIVMRTEAVKFVGSAHPGELVFVPPDELIHLYLKTRASKFIITKWAH